MHGSWEAVLEGVLRTVGSAGLRSSSSPLCLRRRRACSRLLCSLFHGSPAAALMSEGNRLRKFCGSPKTTCESMAEVRWPSRRGNGD